MANSESLFINGDSDADHDQAPILTSATTPTSIQAEASQLSVRPTFGLPSAWNGGDVLQSDDQKSKLAVGTSVASSPFNPFAPKETRANPFAPKEKQPNPFAPSTNSISSFASKSNGQPAQYNVSTPSTNPSPISRVTPPSQPNLAASSPFRIAGSLEKSTSYTTFGKPSNQKNGGQANNSVVAAQESKNVPFFFPQHKHPPVFAQDQAYKVEIPKDKTTELSNAREAHLSAGLASSSSPYTPPTLASHLTSNNAHSNSEHTRNPTPIKSETPLFFPKTQPADEHPSFSTEAAAPLSQPLLFAKTQTTSGPFLSKVSTFDPTPPPNRPEKSSASTINIPASSSHSTSLPDTIQAFSGVSSAPKSAASPSLQASFSTETSILSGNRSPEKIERSTILTQSVDPRPEAIQRVTDALVLERDGFIQQYIEITVAPMVKQAVGDYNNERSWKIAS